MFGPWKKEQSVWRVTQEFYGQAWKGQVCLLPAFHSQEFRHMAKPNCKRGWEMKASYVSMSWSKRTPISIQQFLWQITRSRKILEERDHFQEPEQESSLTHLFPHPLTNYFILLSAYYFPAMNLVLGQEQKTREIFCLPRTCTVISYK